VHFATIWGDRLGATEPSATDKAALAANVFQYGPTRDAPNYVADRTTGKTLADAK